MFNVRFPPIADIEGSSEPLYFGPIADASERRSLWLSKRTILSAQIGRIWWGPTPVAVELPPCGVRMPKLDQPCLR
jgi:hypothetical protein